MLTRLWRHSGHNGEICIQHPLLFWIKRERRVDPIDPIDPTFEANGNEVQSIGNNKYYEYFVIMTGKLGNFSCIVHNNKSK